MPLVFQIIRPLYTIMCVFLLIYLPDWTKGQVTVVEPIATDLDEKDEEDGSGTMMTATTTKQIKLESPAAAMNHNGNRSHGSTNGAPTCNGPRDVRGDSLNSLDLYVIGQKSIVLVR